MRKLILFIAFAPFCHAAVSPRMLGHYYVDANNQSHGGYQYGWHTTAIAGQNFVFEMAPRWSVPITCDPSTQLCTTDATYTPTGSETDVNVVLDTGGEIPGYCRGTYSSVTTPGVHTVLTLSNLVGTCNFATYAAAYTNGYIGVETNEYLAGDSAPNRQHHHTILSVTDATHIVVDAFTEADQTNQPFWFGELFSQYGRGKAVYKVCSVSGNSFALFWNYDPQSQQAGGCPGSGAAIIRQQPFTSAGSSVYLAFYSAVAPYGDGSWITGTSGWPTGTTITWKSMQGNATTYTRVRNAPSYDSYQWLDGVASIPAGATPGPYNPTVTVCQNQDGTGTCYTRTFAITVSVLPSLVGTPSSYPTIPGLTNWASHFTSAFSRTNTWTVNASGTTVTATSGPNFTGALVGTVVMIDGGNFVVSTVDSTTQLHVGSTGGSWPITGKEMFNGSGYINPSFFCDKTDGSIHAAQSAVCPYITLGDTCEPVQFYYPDGIQTFPQLVNYTGDTTWNVCTLSLADLYSSRVNSVDWVGGTRIMQQELFTHGLYDAWLIGNTTQKNNYKTAVNNMVTHQSSQMGATGVGSPTSLGREVSLGLEAAVTWDKMGYGAWSNLDFLADLVISGVLADADFPCDGCASGNQPFYYAYAFQALNDYMAQYPSRKPYALYVMKRGVDWILSQYDATTNHASYYNSAPCGVGCSCQLPNGAGGNMVQKYSDADVHCRADGPVYNQLDMWVSGVGALWANISPSVTPPSTFSTYAQFGDDVFNHLFDGLTDAANWSWPTCVSQNCLGAKQVVQQFGFFGSADYVAFRTGAPPTGCADVSYFPITDSAPSVGGTGSVAVTMTDQTCAWTASSSQAWLTITSGSSGTGNGTIAWSASANSGGPRTATISTPQGPAPSGTITQAGGGGHVTSIHSGVVSSSGVAIQ